MKTLSAKAKISGRMLIKLISMLAMSADVRLAPAQVTNLGIAAVGGQTIIYWPISTTNYVLQTTTNLAMPNWITASNAVTVNAVVVTNSAPSGYFQLLAQTNTTAGMVLIPAGSFLMGNYLFYNSATNDPDISNANPTNVYVSGFYMDTNLVSYSQWQAVYTYATSHGYSFVNAGAGNASNQPVQDVDWFDCVKWSNARSVQAGLIPAYYTDVAYTQVFTNGDTGTMVYLNLTNNGYRLPTEAEWEKASRGGLIGLRFPWGNSISESQAIYFGCPTCFSYDFGPDSGSAYGPHYTSPVGSFAPNGYGLYDMAGNVYEWCWDWHATPYGQPTTNNPTGPATGSERVLRGGSWADDARSARCADRDASGSPLATVNDIGFRCVRRQ
jgi:sulfatase modifying factor 1